MGRPSMYKDTVLFLLLRLLPPLAILHCHHWFPDNPSTECSPGGQIISLLFGKRIAYVCKLLPISKLEGSELCFLKNSDYSFGTRTGISGKPSNRRESSERINDLKKVKCLKFPSQNSWNHENLFTQSSILQLINEDYLVLLTRQTLN